MQSQNPLRSARPEPPIFQYPTLPLNEAFASWLSDPYIPAMTVASHSDRPTSSLSESWALLSSSDTASEEDTRSELTDVASTTGTNGLDDVSSVEDAETSSEIDGRDPTNSESGSESEVATHYGHPSSQVAAGVEDASAATLTGVYSSGSEAIEFEEPERWPDAEQVEMKHTIRIFDEEETAEISRYMSTDYSVQNLVATVRQTMTKESLKLEKPFRVLYAGNPAARHVILDKIGHALVSGTESNLETKPEDSSRYHVVPASFGGGDIPNFAELLPIHVQLVVDECTTASSVKIEKHSDMITLSFKNRSPCHSRLMPPKAKYEIESATPWVLPDVAIIFMTDKDDLIARRTRRFVHAFAKRHGIPVLLVSEEPLWGRLFESVSLNHQSLHLCLESRGSVDRESRVLKKLPIDLKSFESVAPGQMNRNLACLTGLYSENTADPPAPSLSLTKGLVAKSSRDIERSPPNAFGIAESIESLRNWRATRLDIRSILPLGIFLFCGLLYVFANIGLPWLLENPANLLPKVELSNQNSYLPKSVPATTTTSIQAKPSLNTASVLPNSLSALNSQDELAQLLYKPKLEKANNSDHFEVHVLGDCHIIVKSPRKIALAKKAPRFSVQVMRQNANNAITINHELSKLFEGVYTIRLDREDAYGLVNVSIRTRTKPIISQVSEVDFGTPWLKIAGWKKAAQIASQQLIKDLQSAQTGLGIAYERLRTDLEVFAGHASTKAEALRKDYEVRGRVARKIASEKAGVMLAKSRELSVFAAEQGAIASYQFSKQVKTASKVLSLQSLAMSKEVAQYAGESWKMAMQQLDRLREAASSVDLKDVRNKLQLSKGQLSKAQERARRVWKKRSSGKGGKTHPKKAASHKDGKARKGTCGAWCNR